MTRLSGSGNTNEYQKQRREENKRKAVAYLGGACSVCHDDTAVSWKYVHRDPEEAEFHISQGFAKGWDTLRAELDKCALICQKCGWKSKETRDKREHDDALAAALQVHEDRYVRAGEGHHAVLWRDYHNARADLGKPTASCDCDYCEDGYGDKHELPEAYVRLLPTLRFAEDRKPVYLRKAG